MLPTRTKSLTTILSAFDKVASDLDVFKEASRKQVADFNDQIEDIQSKRTLILNDMDRAERVMKKIIGLTA